MRRLLAVAIVGLFSTGCFGRTGIGLDELEAVGALPGVDSGTTTDGSTPGDDSSVSVDDSSVPVDDAVVTTDSGTPPTKDTGIDIFDVIPIPEGGVIGECAGCVRDNCGSAVNKCINDPKCRSGLTCAVTKCLAGGMGGGGGGLDFACLTTCFGGDFSAAATAISAFTCVTGKCGSKCGGFLGGIPGLPGGSGGGSGGGKPGGVPEEWTAEQVMSVDPSTRIGFASEAFSPWAAEISAEAERQASCAP